MLYHYLDVDVNSVVSVVHGCCNMDSTVFPLCLLLAIISWCSFQELELSLQRQILIQEHKKSDVDYAFNI